MARLIDADKEIKWANDNLPDAHAGVITAFLRDCATIDAVTVVRCKDCRHLVFSDCYGECGMGYLGIVNPWDYCSHGERKDKGD